MQKNRSFIARFVGLVMICSIVGFAVMSTGCGSAKHGRVKAKNTGCNCGF
ncbi:MAG: hypothetical protein ACK5GM_08160 [Bacteroidota bacterium]|nr:hypothetical protein [Bacteroidota bacterium]